MISDGEQVRLQFSTLSTPRDIASMLGVSYNRLVWIVHRIPPSERYDSFEIKKRGGGTRRILAPCKPLKYVQRQLNDILQVVYEPKPSVHGFVANRSVVTNASKHRKKKHVLNVDLQDFYPSINFGRVRGMFMARPYKLNQAVSTMLAQICCYDNQLPQGAPTSPVVSNMLCGRLDSELQRLAKAHRCTYTRYADDLTFSTSTTEFPAAMATATGWNAVTVGEDLRLVIDTNGFVINQRKVRLQSRLQRQEVTGLVVNQRVNVHRSFVKELRAMLHAWKKYGPEKASLYFETFYQQKHHRNPEKPVPEFRAVIRGKLAYLRMVKGEDDSVYATYDQQYKDLERVARMYAAASLGP